MVIYNNREWLNSLLNFYRSYVMRMVVRGVLIIGAVTAVLCLAIDGLGITVRFGANVFSWLGIVLSLLLVFRTNTAYDRWWEGRKQWGALVNNSRNLALMMHNLIGRDDRVNRNFYAKHIANFAIALVEHLREGVKLDQLYHLEEAELIEYRRIQHVPNRIASVLYERTQELYRDGFITGYDTIPVKTHIQALIDILGACERIKKTPIPFSYSVYIKAFILAYLTMLPFGLIEEFGYFTVPIVMLVCFAFIGVELLAEEIEDPFGRDCNDLPTGTIATTIRNNVYEILVPAAPEAQSERTETKFEKVF
jgi:ion channel-forming bestrophin family protein